MAGLSAAGALVAVTDHALERWRQRMPRRSGELDERPEIAGRVAHAFAAGAVEPDPARRGAVLVRDLDDRALVYVCRHDVPRGELVVVTLWEDGPRARVPREFTDALRDHDRRRPRD